MHSACRSPATRANLSTGPLRRAAEHSYQSYRIPRADQRRDSYNGQKVTNERARVYSGRVRERTRTSAALTKLVVAGTRE